MSQEKREETPEEESAKLCESAKETYERLFGSPPNFVVQAPGRVNLIGEHTDYTEGFVLPLALEHRTIAVGSGLIVKKTDEAAVCRVLSLDCVEGTEEESIISFDGNPDTLAPGSPKWANYVKGVVKEFTSDLPSDSKFSFQLVLASNVPVGAGLSSSAALEVSTATFLEKITAHPINGVTKALRCKDAENKFCNMPCGIMDQFISALAVEGNALKIDCRSDEFERVPLDPSKAVVVITNSKVKHELTDSGFPLRVQQCASANDALKAKFAQVKNLRDADMNMLDSVKDTMEDVVYRRARHAITENQRVLRTVEALHSGDLKTVGELMSQSHASLQHDYEVTVPQVDSLVQFALEVDGVIGSRMTGGGFGGCTVSLVVPSAVQSLKEHLTKRYEETYNLTPDIFVTKPGRGSGDIACSDLQEPQKKKQKAAEN